MTSNKELLPCPAGHPAQYDSQYWRKAMPLGYKQHRVYCSVCGWEAEICDTKEAAFSAWNTRANNMGEGKCMQSPSQPEDRGLAARGSEALRNQMPGFPANSHEAFENWHKQHGCPPDKYVSTENYVYGDRNSMGWQVYECPSGHRLRWAGYGVPAYCDHPECNEKIDRGLSHICGMVNTAGEERGCHLHFCEKHLRYSPRFGQLCERCYP